jgi:tetratricopeptide (TPR) repeat protein
VQLGRQNTAEAYRQSDALYRKVLATDPRYAPAWVGLSVNFMVKTGQGLLPTKEGFAQAREAAMKALAIDPDYAPAHAMFGNLAMGSDNDLAAAARHLKRALALDPADMDVLANSVFLLLNLGRLDEALALVEAYVRRDPVDVSALDILGDYRRRAGRLDIDRDVPHRAQPRPNRIAGLFLGTAAAEGRCTRRAGGDRAGDDRFLQISACRWRTTRWSQGRLDAAGRADREWEKSLPTTSPMSTLSAGRRTRRSVARQGGRVRRHRPRPNRDGKPVRQHPRRRTLAAVPAQDRQVRSS